MNNEDFTIIFVAKNKAPNRKLFGGFLTSVQQEVLVDLAEQMVYENETN